MNGIPDEQVNNALEKIADMKIFFGHQSVGRNILSGVDDLARGAEIPVRMVTFESGDSPDDVNIFDAHVGENTEPSSKIHDFADMVRSGVGNSVDVAFMKFCYVDTRGDEDIDSFFNRYISEMEELEKEFPQTTFIYMTMPLTSPMTGFQNMIKGILGRLHKTDDGREANIVRHSFNNMLRKAKKQTGRLFDLAAAEATKPNGSLFTVNIEGVEYEALYPGYTWDGGHLDEKGRKVIAKKLIVFLSRLG
ncbi:hypothetical protein B4O97_18930 [Marispirochaeta aestuarii]|uniref:SGNH hydrolase-type esterase domain-containing protein n=1 Tax=Marispirochaeta aestuarii TaxID=1963862 RepID=A0A1Y1RSX3_9SPIO|nr:hypothetical protein [Marispirochaeta aestuarii]ORC28999.1 hypothetical protein B4O97_18930 [Marispirochaeta aestuarii]